MQNPLHRISNLLNQSFAHPYAPLIAVFILAAAGAYILNYQQNSLSYQQGLQGRIIQEQTLIVREECERTNAILRDDNTSHLLDYRFDTTLIKDFAHPIIPPSIPPSITKAQAQATQRATKGFVKILKAEAKGKTWTPPANCTFTHPNYQIAVAIPFSKQSPPAFALANP
jgi:hypothetical protein